MKWFDFSEWVVHLNAWDEIIKKNILINLYRFANPKNFYDICELISFIKAHNKYGVN